MRVLDDWLLTPQRAAIHIASATAVVSDLHLGYGEARRSDGDAVPLMDLEQTLERLQRLFLLQRVRRLVVAGDLFEKRWCPDTVCQFRHFLAESRISRLEIIPGNHDRAVPEKVNGVVIAPLGVDVGGWRVLHGHEDVQEPRTVRGHFHPRLRWNGASAPCFLVSDESLVLPAFSDDAAGVNVLSGRRWHGCHCRVIVGDDVLDFGDVASLKRKRRARQ